MSDPSLTGGNMSITVEQIARHVGLSKAAVSLALRGRPGVSQAVCERVRAAAEELGYRQNPLLGIHMAHVRNSRGPRYQATLGWIDNHPTRDGLRAIPIFNEYYLGACEQAAKLGFKVEEFWLHAARMSPEHLERILLARNITGLIIAPQPFAGGHLEMAWERFSVVTLGYSLVSPRVHLVTNHHYCTMLDAFAKLREFGYQRIGVTINEENNLRVNRAWSSMFWEDYHARSRMSPAEPQLEPLLFHEIKRPLTKEMFVEWFERGRPDAIIVEDYFAPIYEGLRSLGLRVGRDVALALRGVRADDVEHAGMHQNERLIGGAAVDFLVGMLHRNERGVPPVPQRLLVESTWKSGPSVDERGPQVQQGGGSAWVGRSFAGRCRVV